MDHSAGIQRDGEAQAAAHSFGSVRWLSEPRALSPLELTIAESERQKDTARAQVDSRRELAPGAQSRAELAALAKRCTPIVVIAAGAGMTVAGARDGPIAAR